jgi:ferredoxin-nitrite reductase
MSILSPIRVRGGPPPSALLSDCPGLFCPTPAATGILSRVRPIGGRLSAAQAGWIANLVESQPVQAPGTGQILITNRANLQLRLTSALTAAQLQICQAQGLAGPIPAVDHLRNIMVSPTAGVDAQALLDTRPLALALDRYIANSSHLAALSAKFSIGLDGGESVSVRHRYNDIWLVAETNGESAEYPVDLRLFLGLGQGTELDTGLVLRPEDGVALIAAIAGLYLDLAPQLIPPESQHRRSPKPRLRDLVAHWGGDWWIDRLGEIEGVRRWSKTDRRSSTFPQPQPNAARSVNHLGIHPQRQPGFAYVGIVVPLGQLSSTLLRSLAQLATICGSGSLQLTPWQTVLIPDVPVAQILALKQALTELGCSTEATHPAAGVVACAGKPSCAAALTPTQGPAQALIQQLGQSLNVPINIHFSGCAKACAQPYASDIALLGIEMSAVEMGLIDGEGAQQQPGEGYEIYLPFDHQPFGRQLYGAMSVAQAISQVAHMIRVYQRHRDAPDESFGEFAQRQSIPALQALFAVPTRQPTVYTPVIESSQTTVEPPPGPQSWGSKTRAANLNSPRIGGWGAGKVGNEVGTDLCVHRELGNWEVKPPC